MHLPAPLYRLWQKFFVAQKLETLRTHASFVEAASLCELGCGPGNNYPFLDSKNYLGLDVDREYIASARRRYGPHFATLDDPASPAATGRRFDLVLVHSVLHHLDDRAAAGLLELGKSLLAPGGSLHVFDIELPPWWTLAGVLARMDEGRHVRRWADWEPVFASTMTPFTRKDFTLRLFALPAYRMFHLVHRR